jgi:hypothetical protein
MRRGGNWDLGYSRTVQRPDGKLLTMYYYSMDEQPKSTAKSDAEAYGEHSTKVILLQQILFYSARAKKTNALSNVEQLTSLLAELNQTCSINA